VTQWDPNSYLDTMHSEIPAYDELQRQAVSATGAGARRVLELGVGTGETATRVLAAHPHARLIAIDSSPEMLARAGETLPGADLRLARLQDPLPEGTFDLVVSTLAVHHLDAAGKQDLFRRIAAALEPGGHLVLADLVVPDDEADVVTFIDGEYDLPDRLEDQLAWLRDAGLDAETVWSYKDLAVIRATRRRRPG
jgi:tRNA (cmo5U34)-methyltransferase